MNSWVPYSLGMDDIIISDIEVDKNCINTTYGELLSSSVDKILKYINISKDDIFYDLGCGNGKLCIQVHLQTGIRCIGIEYVKDRYEKSKYIVDRFRDNINFDIGKVCFINDNFLNQPLNDGSIFYMCSTCYNITTINQIMSKIIKNSSLKYVLSLVKIPTQWYKYFDIDQLHTPTSWSDNCTTYIYKYINI